MSCIVLDSLGHDSCGSPSQSIVTLAGTALASSRTRSHSPRATNWSMHQATRARIPSRTRSAAAGDSSGLRIRRYGTESGGSSSSGYCGTLGRLGMLTEEPSPPASERRADEKRASSLSNSATCSYLVNTQ